MGNLRNWREVVNQLKPILSALENLHIGVDLSSEDIEVEELDEWRSIVNEISDTQFMRAFEKLAEIGQVWDVLASVYGYITVAHLENYESTNYGNIDATLYNDTNVEVKITIAERIVNGLIGTTYTGIIPDRIIAATTIYAAQMMRNSLIMNGYDMDTTKERLAAEEKILEGLISPEQADNLDKPVMWVKKG